MKFINSYLRNVSRDVDEHFLKLIFSLLEKDKKSSVIDLGCSDGDISIKVISTIQTKKIIGVEISDDLCKKAIKMGINVKKNNLNKKLNFRSCTFDVVFSNQVIEHLYDLDTYISEIYRLLKPGGYAVIGTVNIASWHNIAALFVGWQPFDYVTLSNKKIRVGNPIALHNGGHAGDSFMHVKPFTVRALHELFSIHKFQIEKIVGAGYYPFPSPIFKLLEKFDINHTSLIAFKLRKPKFKTMVIVSAL